MRLILALLAALIASPLIASPLAAQSLSPLTGTTAGTPTAQPTPPAPAQRARRPTMRQRFAAANTTHDGRLTLDQAREAKMVRVVRNFDAIDKSHRGYVTFADLQGYNRAARAARKAAK